MASSSAETPPFTFKGAASRFLKAFGLLFGPVQVNLARIFGIGRVHPVIHEASKGIEVAEHGGYVIPGGSSARPEIEKDHVGDVYINIDSWRALEVIQEEEDRKHCGSVSSGWSDQDAYAKIAGEVEVMDNRGKRIEVVNWSSAWPANYEDASEVHIKNGKVLEYAGDKVEEILLGGTAQVGSSLIVYHQTSSSSTPTAGAFVLAGANGVAFVVILISMLLRGRNARAALVLRKIGAVVASSAIIMAMTAFVAAHHRHWVCSLACILPATVVALA